MEDPQSIIEIKRRSVMTNKCQLRYSLAADDGYRRAIRTRGSVDSFHVIKD
jgi:hypothetical protein